MADSHDKQVQQILKRNGYVLGVDKSKLRIYANELMDDISECIMSARINPNVKNLLISALIIDLKEDKAIITFDESQVRRRSVYTKVKNKKFRDSYATEHSDNVTAYLPLVYNYSNNFEGKNPYYYEKNFNSGVYLTDYDEFTHEDGAQFIENGIKMFERKYPKANIEIKTG